MQGNVEYVHDIVVIWQKPYYCTTKLCQLTKRVANAKPVDRMSISRKLLPYKHLSMRMYGVDVWFTWEDLVPHSRQIEVVVQGGLLLTKLCGMVLVLEIECTCIVFYFSCSQIPRHELLHIALSMWQHAIQKRSRHPATTVLKQYYCNLSFSTKKSQNKFIVTLLQEIV